MKHTLPVAPFFLSWLRPAATALFVATAPYGALAPLWLLTIAVSVIFDDRSGQELRQPDEGSSLGLARFILYGGALLQLAIVPLTLGMAERVGVFSLDFWVAVLLVGVNSGYASIVMAHELVHRTRPGERLLGRALLVTVLYEHFATEHVRGHHTYVGTPRDPATARFGETFSAFFRRSVLGQIRSAWELERQRLAARFPHSPARRTFHNQVLQGLLAESALLMAIGLTSGLAALVVWVLQAAVAVRLLEAVNYVEHWGIVREGRKVLPCHSWDAQATFSLFSLVGLPRHADHHAYAARPYPLLRWREESPKLRHGYPRMVLMSMFRNAKFRRIMTEDMVARGMISAHH